MTKLISPYPGIIVYKDKNGRIISRAKPGPNKKIKTHPQYQRTREQGAAFGKAASFGKTIPHIFHNWTGSAADSILTGRLVKRLLEVMQSGPQENRMEPRLTNGDLSILDGFQFNANAGIDSTFFGRLSILLENDNRLVSMSIPSFIPVQVIKNPNGNCSHFRLIPLIAGINFQSRECALVRDDQINPADPVAWDDKEHKAIDLKVSIDLEGNLVVLIALAIEFYWRVGEKEFLPVAAGGHNALGIIKAYKLCVS